MMRQESIDDGWFSSAGAPLARETDGRRRDEAQVSVCTHVDTDIAAVRWVGTRRWR